MFVKAIRGALALSAAGIALTLAGPAQSDVKAGVEAWAAGDYARAVREWAEPAAKGDPDAQFNLAQAYRLGRGVEIDARQAETLYARAAAQGHVKAADNYGLLLFQDGRREQAMPYIEPAAARGDPRAQYLLGIAHFNGDMVARDWRRAYALMTLANAAGLPQAKSALAQMDEHISLDERQAAQTLASAFRTEAEAARRRDLTEVELALAGNVAAEAVVTAPAPASKPIADPRIAGAAGTDFSRAPSATERAASAGPVRVVQAPLPPAASARMSLASGAWKVQLGAFGVAGNADKLWSKLSSRSELEGRVKLKRPAGRLTRLLAGGFANRDEAEATCASLKAAGQECLVVK